MIITPEEVVSHLLAQDILDDTSKVEGLYLGIGMCGQGFMMGPGVGLNLASLITKGKPLLKQKVFDLLSPVKLTHGIRIRHP